MFTIITNGRVHYNIRAIFLSTESKLCYKYLHKNVILHYIFRKTKVSYYMTFVQTLLKSFLAAFVILSHEIRLQGNLVELVYLIARKGKYIHIFIQDERIFIQDENQLLCLKGSCKEEQKGENVIIFMPYAFQQKKCHVTNIYTGRKTKLSYNIPLRENKSILLHHVLPTLLKTFFLWPLL